MEILQKTILFKNISRDSLAALMKSDAFRLKEYSAGQEILAIGSRTEFFGIVASGNIQIFKEDYRGNRTLVAQAGVGNIFAEAFACTEVETAVTVQSAGVSIVYWINYKTFCRPEIFKPNECSIIKERFTRIFAERNIFLSGRIEHLSKRTLREKVMSYLSEQAVVSGNRTFKISLNRQEMADYLAADRSALSNVLGILRDEGVIQFCKNKFTLL